MLPRLGGGRRQIAQPPRLDTRTARADTPASRSRLCGRPTRSAGRAARRLAGGSMPKRVILVVAFWAVAASVAQAQSNKLAFIIPTLYGPTGLKVDSAAPITNPDGSISDHSAHFNSAFQSEFTQFNISIASQLAAIPLPSPASGFTYSLDPTLGVMKRSTQSFGPIFAERAETIGKNKFSVGING